MLPTMMHLLGIETKERFMLEQIYSQLIMIKQLHSVTVMLSHLNYTLNGSDIYDTATWTAH